MQEKQENLLTPIQMDKRFKFQDTTATRKIFQLRKRIRAVRGGTSASKTISILVWLIDYCQSFKGDELCSVVSESFPHLERGAITDFKSIMLDRGYWQDSQWNGGKHQYTFSTGNRIEFFSGDTLSKVHGPRREMLFVNECNNLPWQIVDHLIVRTRKVVWLDWNPVEEFWFDTEMYPTRMEDVDLLTLTYKDNEALDSVTINEIESHRNNEQWWRVYGLGLPGVVEGRIYSGWQIIEEVPHEARLERYGLDFGYSNDPTAVIGIYKYNESFILDEEIYQKGMLNKQIADWMNNRPRALIIADSAEPKSIDELKLYGISVLGCDKARNSILQGVQHIQGQRISVTKRSVNLIKEYRNYYWLRDKLGKVMNEPQDLWNHALDAVRYAMSTLRTEYLGKRKKEIFKKKKSISGYSLKMA